MPENVPLCSPLTVSRSPSTAVETILTSPETRVRSSTSITVDAGESTTGAAFSV